MRGVLVVPDSIAGRADVLPPAFVCSSTDGGLDAAWVQVAGELDIATTPELERALGRAQARSRLVVLDLRGLAFMDSSGVHAIASASIRARNGAGRLIVLRGPPDVDRVVRLSGGMAGVEILDLDREDSPAHVLVQRVGEELAS